MFVKHDVDIKDLNMLHPLMLPILGFLMTYCFDHNLECRITSLYRAGDNGPHGDNPCRAVDFSVHGWEQKDILRFKNDITIKYGYLGAISRSDHQQRIVIFHGEGANYHGHLQLIKGLPIH